MLLLQSVGEGVMIILDWCPLINYKAKLRLNTTKKLHNSTKDCIKFVWVPLREDWLGMIQIYKDSILFLNRDPEHLPFL